jgi:flagellar hook-associated protein 1 FlgK
MPALTQLLYTARDALGAQSYGLGVTGQNISNVNTPGYVRREAQLETRALGTATTGSVAVTGLRRATDVYIEQRDYTARGNLAAASEHDRQLGSIEALFNDISGTGLGSSLDALFGSFSALAANPSDPTAREQVLGAAQSFSDRVNVTAEALAQTKTDLLKQAQATVEQINARAADISTLNRRIQQAEAQGEDAADLKDQRNKLLLDLSELVDIRTIGDGAGNLVIQAAGSTLVDGGEARQLGIDLDSNGELRLLSLRDGAPDTEITRFLTGGKLAGIKEARDVDVFDVENKLDQLVFDVANAINAQHALGFGLDGASGRNLFDVGGTVTGAAQSLRLGAAVAGNPNAIAAAGSLASVPGGSSNAAALADIWKSPVSGGRTAAEAYGDLVGSVGQRKAALARAVETQGAIRDQLQAMREAVSGVSLDEEMVALTKFQRAYEAAGRVLTTVDQLLQDLINRVGR